nr:hypothetical protein [Segatella bryantii]
MAKFHVSPMKSAQITATTATCHAFSEVHGVCQAKSSIILSESSAPKYEPFAP